MRFENPEMLRICEKEVEQKQGRNTTVGIKEYLLEKAKNEGEKNKAVAIACELKKEGLAIDFIAKTTKLTVKEIEKLK